MILSWSNLYDREWEHVVQKHWQRPLHWPKDQLGATSEVHVPTPRCQNLVLIPSLCVKELGVSKDSKVSPDLLGLNKEIDQSEALNLQTWPVSKRGCNWTHTHHISELVLFCWISSWNLTGQTNFVYQHSPKSSPSNARHLRARCSHERWRRPSNCRLHCIYYDQSGENQQQCSDDNKYV